MNTRQSCEWEDLSPATVINMAIELAFSYNRTTAEVHDCAFYELNAVWARF